jgi:hypothetical protein
LDLRVFNFSSLFDFTLKLSKLNWLKRKIGVSDFLGLAKFSHQ